MAFERNGMMRVRTSTSSGMAPAERREVTLDAVVESGNGAALYVNYSDYASTSLAPSRPMESAI